MTAFETYGAYLALKRHFTTDQYDYFRYNGIVKYSAKSFENRRDKHAFLKISRHIDPVKLMASNFIYGDASWPGSMDPMLYDHLVKRIDTGPYWFAQDLQHLSDDFNQNFSVGATASVPLILQLVVNKRIDIHTACVFNSILHTNDVWKTKPQYLIFEDISKKVDKATGFFQIDNDKYKAVIAGRFNSI